MTRAVLATYARTPFHFARKGALAGVRPDDLAAAALKAVVERSGIDPATLDDVLLGCASFPGTDPQAFAEPLSFLHHFAPPLDGWQVRACASETSTPALVAVQEINAKRALHSLPPLIKGYLRLGAKVLGAPAWDPDFNTADLPMMMRIADLPARYKKHFASVAQ